MSLEVRLVTEHADVGSLEQAVGRALAEAGLVKARGMSWFRRGASPLLHLRLLRLNGTWNRYWSQRFAAARRPWPVAA